MANITPVPSSKMKSSYSSTIDKEIKSYNIEKFVSSSFYLQEAETSPRGEYYLFNASSVLEAYRSEFKEIEITHTLSNTDYLKYRYNPKRLSQDLYGTTELWALILAANELYSVAQFDLSVVKIFSSKIYNTLTTILSNDKTLIDVNREYISNILNPIISQ